jgi:hypothetical protein
MNCKFLETSRKTFGHTSDEVTEQFRKLHNEELRDLYRSAGMVGSRNSSVTKLRSERPRFDSRQ